MAFEAGAHRIICEERSHFKKITKTCLENLLVKCCFRCADRLGLMALKEVPPASLVVTIVWNVQNLVFAGYLGRNKVYFRIRSH